MLRTVAVAAVLSLGAPPGRARAADSLWRALPGPKGAVWAVSVSSDGSVVAAASDWIRDRVRGGEIRVWRRGSSEPAPTIQDSSSPITVLALSPDGRTVAAAASDGIRLWDASDGALRQTLSGEGGVSALAWSSDGSLLLSQSAWRGRGEVRFRTAAGQMARSVLDREETFSGFALSADGRTLATIGSSSKGAHFLRIWDARTGRLRRTLGRKDKFAAVAVSPDGATVAAAAASRAILWNARTGQLLRSLDDAFLGLVFSADGRRLVGLETDAIVVLDPSNWERRRTLPLDVAALCLAVSGDGRTLATGHGDSGRGEVRLWDLSGPAPGAAAPVGRTPAPAPKPSAPKRTPPAPKPSKPKPTPPVGAPPRPASAAAPGPSVKDGREFLCGSVGVTKETPLADVIDGLGDKLALRPTQEPCRYDLLYERGGAKPRVVSKTQGMYLAAVGRRFKTPERDETVVCASAISHTRATPPPGKAPDDLNRRVDAVTIDCAAALGDRWTPTNTVVTGGNAWAAWIQSIAPNPQRGAQSFLIRFTRDSTFRYLRAAEGPRPETDGVYETTITVDPKLGPAASASTMRVPDAAAAPAAGGR